MKIALVSHILPPSESGQAMILYRLFQKLRPDDYCLISTRRYDFDQFQPHHIRKLPGRYYHLPAGLQVTRGYRFGLSRLREGINLPLAILQQGRQIADIVRREKCEAVLACTGEVTSLLPAGYWASKLAGVPFYAYVMDHYSYREWESPIARFFAKRLEPLLLKGAARILVTNEILRDELRRQYGVEATVIHNPCDLAAYQKPLPDAAGDEGEVKIVYTGAIYEAHYDAFQNLFAALRLLGRENIKLHLYTAMSTEQLKANGINDSFVYHPHHEESEMPQIQRRADILFLPMAFNSPYPQLVNTSGPTKLGEYLAARRPILVHAPPDSFVSWYFRRHECGLVVDEPDITKLAQAVERLTGDVSLQQRLAARAWEQAQSDFDIAAAQAAFAKLFHLSSGAPDVDRPEPAAYCSAGDIGDALKSSTSR